MSRVRFLPEARADLHAIWDFIAGDDVERATTFTDEIEGLCATLTASPAMGREREELAPGLRSFPFGKYLIFYRPFARGIEVVRVLHGARDVPAMFRVKRRRP